MNQAIESQIQNINEALAWVKCYRPNDYAQQFLQLVGCRKELRKVVAAAEENPGIAAFGKSQVGKSYLFSCLLQGNDGAPYMVRAADRSYNFIYDINPPSAEGGGTESTGVVSRFSSFSRTPEDYNVQLPVLVKTFSVKDVVLILADTYYNDVKDYDAMGENEIRELCEALEEKYAQNPPLELPAVTADDVLVMQEYFKHHLDKGQSFLKASFFSRLALVVEQIPVDDYASVFSNLWHEESNLTNLFRKLLDLLVRLDFARKVYLPIESVLHHGKHEDTIMSVQCLNQLLNDTADYRTDVYVHRGGAYVKVLSDISKSAICAICAEVVFHIDESFVKSSRSYCFEGMDPKVKSRFTQHPVEMSMLADNDLLDFPGARSRLTLYASVLAEQKALLNCFLRGKVAYIFNKYNEEMRINILLFCHHNKDNDVTYLYQLLDDWVDNYVGSTPELRAAKLKQTGCSPLFFIGTMFNLDMKLGVGEQPTETVADERWNNRFGNIVNKQVLNASDGSWASNWTQAGDPFRNSYVLRDFKFSTDLYDGFKAEHRETGMRMERTFYDLLRTKFIGNGHVQQRVADPEKAWEAAASQGNDGALYILENLQEVASRMNEARDKDFAEKVERACSQADKAVHPYYVSTNKEGLLKENVRKARAIFREMDFTCNADNYYFGHLLQAMQLDAPTSYRVVHEVMHGTKINSLVNDFTDYELILASCKAAGHPVTPNLKQEEQWQCLMSTYGFDTKAEAADYLQSRHVDSEKLFSGSYKRKMNSYIIGDALYAYWSERLKSADFLTQHSGENLFDSVVMGYLTDDMLSTSEAVGLSDAMADSIAEYVNVVDIHTGLESLIADVLASQVNKFVLDFGYSFLNEDQIVAARNLCQREKLPAFDWMVKEEQSVDFGEEELTTLFNELSASPMALLPSFEHHYRLWIEYMFVSFVSHLNQPDYNPEANEQLEHILHRLAETKA